MMMMVVVACERLRYGTSGAIIFAWILLRTFLILTPVARRGTHASARLGTHDFCFAMVDRCGRECESHWVDG
jgi:hypothetical protein